MNNPGWIGTALDLQNFLIKEQADTDKDGNFMVGGKNVCVGLGGDEVVVPSETVYYKEGKAIPLAANMPASKGVRVMVF